MSVPTLDDALGPATARHLRKELRGQGLKIDRDTSGWEARGFTEAYLLAVVVKRSSGDQPQPQRCIAKVFPRGVGADETARHHDALDDSPRPFAEKHLVPVAFERVACPDGTVVVGFDVAAGRLSCLQLADLKGQALVDACATVRAGVLEKWTGPRYDKVTGKSWPELLRRELRGERSLRAWGDEHGLRDAAVRWIHLPPDGVLPNPLRYDRRGVRVGPRLDYLTGFSHGDLHAGNVLIPVGPGGAPRPAKFRLIDLAAFEKDAPLSRDPAMLLLSVLSRRIDLGPEQGTLPPDQQDALLRYLVSNDTTDLDAVPPVLVRLVDALRDPGKAPFIDTAWSEVWVEQFRVSLLAAALKHCMYRSVGPAGRWWCLRLAARLTHQLSPESTPTQADLELTPAIFDDDPQPKPPDPTFINHHDDYAQLRTSLLGGRPRVIKVHGRPGVGKSRLVGTVLAELAAWTGRHGRARRVVCHDVSPAARVSVQTLIEDIEGGASIASIRRNGSWLVRLEQALRSREQDGLVIVIDSAQWLLRAESGELADLHLDHALELLATDPGHRITVVFVSPDAPVSWPGHTWPSRDAVVTIDGLDVNHFVAYLNQLDPGHALELTDLPRPTLEALRDQLDGNPRLAELLRAIIAHNTEAADARHVADDVLAWDRTDMSGQLLRELIKHLPPFSRPVLAALAAYATPVTARQVSALASPAVPEQAVRATLLQLVDSWVVRRSGDRFYLPASDTEHILTHLSNSDRSDSVATTGLRESLLIQAAAELSNDRTPAEQLRSPSDLGAHFAELHAWLRAGQSTAAYGLIEQMDPLLRKWNRADLLLQQREQIRHQLASDRDKLGNLNALGDIYAAQGRFDLADDAYKHALEYVIKLDNSLAHRRVIANMATTCLRRNETARADELFSQALVAAERAADTADQWQALEGLAHCQRRWGEYESALAYAEAALALVRAAGSPRQVTLLMRLARWYAELGRQEEAELLIHKADTLTRRDGFRWLRPAWLDGHADLLLDDDHLNAPEIEELDGAINEAIRMATAAVEGALAQQDPVTLVQARTTQCVAYLKLNKINEAGREITRAAHYPQPQPSLLVLALSALMAQRQGEAARAGVLFEKLRAEASGRYQRDRRDFAALDFEGLALCGCDIDGSGSLDRATRVFRDARRQTPPTPGLVSRLVFLLEQLQHDRPGRLQPVIAAVRSAQSRPWRSAEGHHQQD